jgi:hypothetical protein
MCSLPFWGGWNEVKQTQRTATDAPTGVVVCSAMLEATGIVLALHAARLKPDSWRRRAWPSRGITGIETDAGYRGVAASCR